MICKALDDAIDEPCADVILRKESEHKRDGCEDQQGRKEHVGHRKLQRNVPLRAVAEEIGSALAVGSRQNDASVADRAGGRLECSHGPQDRAAPKLAELCSQFPIFGKRFLIDLK